MPKADQLISNAHPDNHFHDHDGHDVESDDDHDDHDKGDGDNDIVSRDYLLPESDKWPKAQDSTVQTDPGKLRIILTLTMHCNDDGGDEGEGEGGDV